MPAGGSETPETDDDFKKLHVTLFHCVKPFLYEAGFVRRKSACRGDETRIPGSVDGRRAVGLTRWSWEAGCFKSGSVGAAYMPRAFAPCLPVFANWSAAMA